MTIRLLILDEDTDYVKALQRQLTLAHKGFVVEIGWEDGENPGCAEAAVEVCAGHNDLLLLGEYPENDLVKTLYQSFSERRCVVRLAAKGKENTETQVLRYGSVSALGALLKISFGAASGKKQYALDYGGKTKLSGFLGFAGNGGKTQAMITLGRFLAREEAQKVLYLNLEELETGGFYFRQQRGGGAADEFLYYLFSRDEAAAATYLEAFLAVDEYGLYAFRPSLGRNALAGLSEEEWISLLKMLLRYGEFDQILLDLPCSLRQESLFLIRSCSILVFVGEPGEFGHYQLRHMQKCLETCMDLDQLPQAEVVLAPDEAEEAGRRHDQLYGYLGREMSALAEQLFLQ